MSSTFKKEEAYFSSLAEKVYLTPDNFSLKECVRILSLLQEDLNFIKNLDVSNASIYYSKSDLGISPEDLNFVNDDVEEQHFLNSITDSYGFTNIQNEGKKK